MNKKKNTAPPTPSSPLARKPNCSARQRQAQLRQVISSNQMGISASSSMSPSGGGTKQSEARLIVARWTKCVTYFIYAMLALGFMNDVARADYTVSISVIGLIAVWFRKQSPCYLYFWCLVGTLLLDVLWLCVHGLYLDRFGSIPLAAPETIVDLMRLHKWSLGVSCLQILTKTLALYPVWKYYLALLVLDKYEIVSDVSMERMDLIDLSTKGLAINEVNVLTTNMDEKAMILN